MNSTTKILIPAFALILTAVIGYGFVTYAHAQTSGSTVTGTLTTGAAQNNGISGTVTNAPGSGSLSGTVTSQTGTGTGGTGTGTGGGGGGGGSGSNTIDICPNISGVQSSLPSGYVLQNGNCVLSSTSGSGTGTGTGGTTPGTPNTGGTSGTGTTSSSSPGVPNTGAGGDAAITFAVLAGSLAAAIFGFRKMRTA